MGKEWRRQIHGVEIWVTKGSKKGQKGSKWSFSGTSPKIFSFFFYIFYMLIEVNNVIILVKMTSLTTFWFSWYRFIRGGENGVKKAENGIFGNILQKSSFLFSYIFYMWIEVFSDFILPQTGHIQIFFLFRYEQERNPQNAPKWSKMVFSRIFSKKINYFFLFSTWLNSALIFVKTACPDKISFESYSPPEVEFSPSRR